EPHFTRSLIGFNGGGLLFLLLRGSPRSPFPSKGYPVPAARVKKTAAPWYKLRSNLMGPHAPLIRFGFFEVNTRSGELLRHGFRVRLPHQPFQVLALLLEHPGEVVTREELRRRLWPDDIVVDFDRGLNKAINSLRGALRDRAEKPRFVETLPKRGYRFIAPVESGAPIPDQTLPA